MHKVKYGTIPNIFKDVFKINQNRFSTRSTKTSFYKPMLRTKYNQFSIVYRGPHLWNNLISDTLQTLPYHSFKSSIKRMLFDIDDVKENFFLSFTFLYLHFLLIFFSQQILLHFIYQH